ncbi:MAG TPA: GreA/GreB family elongation factor [Verrucomicrobiae bacterium]|nr:GreA/GreB family elongation factor [Verrucomicrobiae bacterium]
MSKAFTRESDEVDREEVPSGRVQLPPGARNYITRKGADLLRQRLEALHEQRRAEAGAGEKTDTKAAQRRVESAIRRLQSILDSVVIAGQPEDREKIAFGASVVVKRGNEEEEAYTIVGIDEAEPERGYISWVSPLARALLGRRAGEVVRFRSPAGEQDLKVVKVCYGGE